MPQNPGKWPKKHKFTARVNSTFELAHELGLSPPFDHFYDFDRVTLECLVAEDGTVTILTCDGIPLERSKDD